MIERILHENVSALQRLLLRGARYQLLFIAFLIVLVSVLFERLVEGRIEGRPPMPAWLYILRLKSGNLYIVATKDLDAQWQVIFGR